MSRRTQISPWKTPLFSAVGTALALALAGCESSSTTSLGPSSVAKCQVAVTGGQLTVDAGGGVGSITVSAEPECGWTVSAAANWISGLAPANGQGNGEIKFQVAPNATNATRQADISVNGATGKVTQAGAPCRIDITPRSQTVPAEGGTGTVTVTALSGCSWTVTSDASWLTAQTVPADAGGGTGPGTVSFSATANAGVARLGNLTIGDQTFVVAQQAPGAAECTYIVQPGAASIDVDGGPVTLAVKTGAGCSWTAASNVPWLTVGGSGTAIGSGSLTITVLANTGAARTGEVTIAGQTFRVTQAARSGFALQLHASTFGAIRRGRGREHPGHGADEQRLFLDGDEQRSVAHDRRRRRRLRDSRGDGDGLREYRRLTNWNRDHCRSSLYGHAGGCVRLDDRSDQPGRAGRRRRGNTGSGDNDRRLQLDGDDERLLDHDHEWHGRHGQRLRQLHR